MAQMTCQNLSVGYDNRAILKNLNFSINRGEYLCIVGENGAGKSTLMKTLLHLLPPVSGKILLGDGLTENEIGYLPQKNEEQKGFPDCSLRMPAALRSPAVLQQKGKSMRGGDDGKNGDHRAGREMFQRTFRWAAAESFVSPGSLRDRKASVPR